MLEQLNDLPANVAGVRAKGSVTKADYERVVTPLLDSSRHEGHRLRLLYELGSEFERFSAGALLEDARIGVRNFGALDRAAVVTDDKLVRFVVEAVGGVVPYPLRGFKNQERDEAIEWLGAPPHHQGISHQLLPNLGVIVVRVTGPITTEDFEALWATADAELARHGRIDGLVIELRTLPAWQNVGAFLRHVAFIGSLRGKVDKLAFVFERKLASVAASIANTMLGAHVRCFGEHELKHAVDWAQNTEPSPAANGSQAADRVEQAGFESFPASDPPSYNPGN